MNSEIDELLPLPSATFHILVALADEDRHGYAIMRTDRRRGEAQRRDALPIVQRMLEQGLIVEVAARPAREMDDERRRYYRITPSSGWCGRSCEHLRLCGAPHSAGRAPVGRQRPTGEDRPYNYDPCR